MPALLRRAALLCCCCLTACRAPAPPPPADAPSPPPESAAPRRVTHATGFSLTDHAGYRLLTLQRSWRGEGEATVYCLLDRGATPPPGFDPRHVIRVPVQRCVMMSTTYLPPLAKLGLLDRLVGISGGQYLAQPEVRQRLAAGQVADVGEGATINLERLIALQPDLVMTFDRGDATYDHASKIAEAGLPLVLNADFLETTPLGRAEWLKYVAAFFGADEAAARWFGAIVQRYEALRATAAKATARPTVLFGSQFGGTWFVPGGRNWSAQYLADAGADYLWASDPSTNALELGFETVFATAQAADCWLHPSTEPTSLARLRQQDARLGQLRAVQTGQVYNNTGRIGADGGNAYHEQGAVEPDVILADLVRIFHPELLPDHQLAYYVHVPPEGPAR